MKQVCHNFDENLAPYLDTPDTSPPNTEHLLQVNRETCSSPKFTRNSINPDTAGEVNDSGIGMLMNLRKTANHPLLVRDLYTDAKLAEMAKLLKAKDSGHKDAQESFIIEDLQSMSDYQIHRTCEYYRCIEGFKLDNEVLCQSGKFKKFDELLPKMKENGDRVLIFSQFTMLMDIMERYLKTRGYKYLQLDGQTPVQERQFFID